MDIPDYVRSLDEYFMTHYSDYMKIAAIEGYKMPEVIYIAKDGNVARREPSSMRLCYQEERDLLLARFKAGLADTDFSFSYYFRPLRDKFADLFRRRTFARLLPSVLARTGETVESVEKRLTVESRFFKKIIKGSLYPEKNLIFAIALASRMEHGDVEELLDVCGFSFDDTRVRDVVIEYLIVQRVSNPQMQRVCLKEYAIDCIPLNFSDGTIH